MLTENSIAEISQLIRRKKCLHFEQSLNAVWQLRLISFLMLGLKASLRYWPTFLEIESWRKDSGGRNFYGAFLDIITLCIFWFFRWTFFKRRKEQTSKQRCWINCLAKESVDWNLDKKSSKLQCSKKYTAISIKIITNRSV